MIRVERGIPEMSISVGWEEVNWARVFFSFMFALTAQKEGLADDPLGKCLQWESRRG